MLYREIIAVCSQIHTKHTNTPCGKVSYVAIKQTVHIWSEYIKQLTLTKLMYFVTSGFFTESIVSWYVHISGHCLLNVQPATQLPLPTSSRHTHADGNILDGLHPVAAVDGDDNGVGLSRSWSHFLHTAPMLSLLCSCSEELIRIYLLLRYRTAMANCC